MIADAQENISFAEFELDTAHRRLLREGEPVVLYAKTFDLLDFLVQKNGQVVSKDEILDAVWPGQFVEEANLSVQISALRKALGERANAPRFLITIPGKGYKFVADIRGGNGEIVIERHKISRVVVEEEISDEKAALANYREPKTLNWKAAMKPIVVAFAGVILIGIAFAAYWYLIAGRSGSSLQNAKLTRLTNSGNVLIASVSNNGNFIAYVTSEAEGNSLWLRQVGTASDIRLLPPTKAEFWGLIFSPDGKYIIYNLFFGDKADTELFRIPLLGGVAEKIPNVITGAVTFSPDGKRIAYIQPDSAANMNYLITADSDGGNAKIVVKKPHPNTFVFAGRSAAWSPDGGVIACTLLSPQADASYTSIAVFDPEIGTEIPLGELRWSSIYRIEWLKDGSGLLISASEKASDNKQVWFVSYPDGRARQVTHDLNDYSSLSAVDDGSFIAVQTNSVNNVFVGETGSENIEFTEIAEETGELQPLVWTADGRIVFRSSKDGTANLWSMDPLGANRRQLTTNAHADTRGMCATPDGKYLVFTSWRSGKSNLWRVDADGGNQLQLTNSDADAYPQCLPDNRTIVFQRGIYTKPALWKVSVSGGDAALMTDFRAKWPSLSADGSRISYFHMVKDAWRISVLSTDDASPLLTFDAPSNLRESTVHWSPDNKLLYYIGASGNVGNIWTLSVDDGHTRQFTKFTSHLLSDFSFSPDGKWLAVTRTTSFSDVIMFENNER